VAAHPKLSPANWLEAEGLYRAGALSNQDIATRYAVSEAAIRQRARKEGWIRATAATRNQLVEAKLLEQRGRSGDGSGLKLEDLVDLQASDDARTLTEAAELFRDGIRKAKEMLPLCETPDQAKKVMDAGQVAAVGFIRVRRLDERSPDTGGFEAAITRLLGE
jgi:hypothetical protein